MCRSLVELSHPPTVRQFLATRVIFYCGYPSWKIPVRYTAYPASHVRFPLPLPRESHITQYHATHIHVRDPSPSLNFQGSFSPARVPTTCLQRITGSHEHEGPSPFSLDPHFAFTQKAKKPNPEDPRYLGICMLCNPPAPSPRAPVRV